MKAIADVFCLKPFVVLGFVLVGGLLYLLYQKNKRRVTPPVITGTMLLYYYFCMLFYNVVGIPTYKEFVRTEKLGESLFSPNLELVPFADGINIAFILNVFCFIPLGFLCAVISRSYAKISRAALMGLGVSLLIEISQMFTLHRASDVNDLIANTSGVILGCLCFRVAVNIRRRREPQMYRRTAKRDGARALPVWVTVIAFAMIFVS